MLSIFLRTIFAIFQLYGIALCANTDPMPVLLPTTPLPIEPISSPVVLQQAAPAAVDTGARDSFKDLLMTDIPDMPEDGAPAVAYKKTKSKPKRAKDTNRASKRKKKKQNERAPKNKSKKNRYQIKTTSIKGIRGSKTKIRPSSVLNYKDPLELDFNVLNKTGRTVYVCCFAYLRRHDFSRWTWYKSPVYEIKSNKSQTIDVNTVRNEQDRKNVFGYLAVFSNPQEAQQATYELINDRDKLDLDRLYQLKGKTVTLHIEKYGFKGEFIEYDFEYDNKIDQEKTHELDFAVENRTNTPVLVCGFVYMKRAKGSWVGATEGKDDMAVWRFDKTPLVRIEPNKVGIIDVDTIVTKRDQSYVRGYLAVFGEHESELAQAATYELLDSSRKINLGPLKALGGKKVVLDVENYGIVEKPDFVIKPIKRINFTKIKKK